MAGWIKLHRKIQEHWLFSFSEPDKALAFIDLVLSASFDDGTVMIKGRTYAVKRGQFLVAQTTLQKRWKWSQNKVKRFLNLLKNERMVDLETDERTSIITICNYMDYQSGERADGRTIGRPSERAVERATNEQSNDIKRSKELQEGEEVKAIVDSGESPVEQKDFYEVQFDRLWKYYPVKKSKVKSKSAFNALVKGKKESQVKFWVDLILFYHTACIERGDIGADKLHASTLINQKRWQDEPEFFNNFKRDWIAENGE